MSKKPIIKLLSEELIQWGEHTKIIRKYQIIYQKKVKYETKRFLSKDTIEEYKAKREAHDENVKKLQDFQSSED